MLAAVSSALTQVLEWVGTVISSMVDSAGALNPLLILFAVGIAISLVLLGVKIVKRIVWGA